MKKFRRPVCLLLSCLLIILLVVLMVLLVAPEVKQAVSILVTTLPAAMERLMANETLNAWLPQISAWLESLQWNQIVLEVVNFLREHMGGLAGSVIGTLTTVVSGIMTAVIALVFSLYLLLDKDRLRRQVTALGRKVLGQDRLGTVEHLAALANRNFRRFIVGQCTEAVILGGLCALGMVVFRFPYAVMVGVLVGFTALIPVVGAFFGAAVGAFMILTVSPMQALLFVIFFVVLQQFEGNFIYPRVVGGSLGLPALWVLAAVTIGAGLGGIGGMLLGVPLAATIYQILKEFVKKVPES